MSRDQDARHRAGRGFARRRPTARPEDPIDHAVGFSATVPVGAEVRAGDPLAIVHARDEADAGGRLRPFASLHGRPKTGRAGPVIADRAADHRIIVSGRRPPELVEPLQEAHADQRPSSCLVVEHDRLDLSM